jgi:hypothetical protein
MTDAQLEAAAEIRRLAEEFERDDEAAFRRSRIVCWLVVAVVTILTLGLLGLGGNVISLGILWLVIVGLTWIGYYQSSRRQRHQTSRLRELADRWLEASPGAASPGETGAAARPD